MKAISIRQPWPWLITMGYKPVENRSWETLWRGPFGHVLQGAEPVHFQPCKGALGYFKLPQGVVL